MSLAQALSHIDLNIDDLLLDANNPRFSELGEGLITVPETRYAEEKIQSKTLEKMKAPIFNVGELKDTIKTVGYLPMDRIIVRPWKGTTGKYVVVEGNRRVTALKWLIQLHEVGKESFSEEQLKNFTKIPCLLLDESIAPAQACLILPGLRHVSGIKQWGPYQKAKTVFALRQSGMSAQEAAQSLGLSTIAANRSYRCFMALEKMAADEEFGEKTTHDMYSYFEETFKRPEVRDWLGWDEPSGEFKNESNLREFYSWMVADDEESSAKLPEAKSIREFARIVNDPPALQLFRSESGTLRLALARYDAEHPEQWEPKMSAATQALKGLTPDMLREMSGDGEAILLTLKDRIEKTLDDRSALLGL
ncbi:MAG: ParB N-terminal domain-containing protein [Candidatus Nitrotoga sp.]